MEDTRITFETAKLAKEKGFKEGSRKGYLPNGEIGISHYDFLCHNDEEDYPTKYAAPTQSLLQKWLMEKYRIFININYDGNDEVFRVEIIKQNNDRSRKVFYLKEENIIMMFHSYEDALEISLQEALKLIDNK